MYKYVIKRLIDFVLSSIAIVVLAIPIPFYSSRSPSARRKTERLHIL